jgi:hypothetical protein
MRYTVILETEADGGFSHPSLIPPFPIPVTNGAI